MKKNKNLGMKRFNNDGPLGQGSQGISGVATLIITIVVISIGIGVVALVKNYSSKSVEQVSSLLGQYTDLAAYDGVAVSGTDVTDLIRKSASSTMAVLVSTKANTAHKYYVDSATNKIMNSAGSSGATEVTLSGAEESADSGVFKGDASKLSSVSTAIGYINPKATFVGTAHRDDNGILDCIIFVQQ